MAIKNEPVTMTNRTIFFAEYNKAYYDMITTFI